MKVLIVGNNKTGKFSPFVIEQVDSLKNIGVEVEYFGVSKKKEFYSIKDFCLIQEK